MDTEFLHGLFRDSETFRYLFERIVRRCMEAGLVGGEGFAVDASLIRADANRQRAVAGGETIDWRDAKLCTRAVREYLRGLEATNPADSVPKSISLTDPAHAGQHSRVLLVLGTTPTT